MKVGYFRTNSDIFKYKLLLSGSKMAYDYVGREVQVEFEGKTYMGIIKKHDKDDDSFHLLAYELGLSKILMKNALEDVEPEPENIRELFFQLDEQGFTIDDNLFEVYDSEYRLLRNTKQTGCSTYAPEAAKNMILFGTNGLIPDILDRSSIKSIANYIGKELHVSW